MDKATLAAQAADKAASAVVPITAANLTALKSLVSTMKDQGARLVDSVVSHWNLARSNFRTRHNRSRMQ